FFSKVFEKLIHKRIMKFVEDNSILSPHQFGFQSGKNTSIRPENRRFPPPAAADFCSRRSQSIFFFSAAEKKIGAPIC
ncbi:hypothetical protein CAPTEDRAFT_125500, partial [Capitella teleta]